MALIDIHTHILYGVDDGAKDINDSMGLLDEEREQGVDQVILTPHYGPKFGHPDTEVLREKFEAIREKAHKYYPEIQLYLGSELYYQQGTVSDLKQGKALTMNGTRYVLVEFATSDAYSHIYRAVQDFVYAGYIPILAHVERYKAVFGHVDKIVELIETGAYIQINAESLIGGIFDKRASFCKKIMKEGLVHFLGTDCHDFRTRRPNMKPAAKYLIKEGIKTSMYELENDDEIEIDLRELFLALKKKIVWILLTAIVFAGASGLITKFAMTPIYSSTAQLYVVSKGGLSQLTDLTMGSQLTQDYMVIVKTRPVLEQVIADLKLDMDYKELEKKITVENPSDTRIMQITITDKDAALAQSITQDLAEVTAKTVAEKMDVKSPTIIEKAYKADKPDSPSLKKNVLIGAVLGFILMAAAIVIQYLMNDTILKEEDIEKYLGINTLAQLPLVKGTTKRTKKVKRARE